MEKYLKPVAGGSSASLHVNSRSLKPGAQRKLRDCKKVVSLGPSTRVVFSLETVLQAKEVLDSAESSAEQILEKLRFLSCLQVNQTTLLESGVGVSVRRQKKSMHAEVASLAARIVEKWKKVVLSEQPSRKGHLRPTTTQPG